MKFDDTRLAQHRATKPGSKFRCRLTPPRKYRRRLGRLFSALSPLPGSSHDGRGMRSPLRRSNYERWFYFSLHPATAELGQLGCPTYDNNFCHQGARAPSIPVLKFRREQKENPSGEKDRRCGRAARGQIDFASLRNSGRASRRWQRNLELCQRRRLPQHARLLRAARRESPDE